MSIEDQLSSLKIELPKAPAPVVSYVAHKKIGNLIFISGQIPIKNDGTIRNSVGSIYQFKYGIDGLDPEKAVIEVVKRNLNKEHYYQ